MTHAQRSHRTGLAPILLAMLLLAGQNVPASAHVNTHFGSGYSNPCDDTVFSQCIANNNFHPVKFFSLDAEQSAATTWVMDNVFNSGTTDIDAYAWIGGSYDVDVQDADYGLNGFWAWTACWITATHGSTGPNRDWCTPQYLKFNLRYKANYTGATNTRKVACHEMGHTTGLRHYLVTGSCMYNPATGGSTTLSADDRTHLTGYY